jgi:hypothetical protein
MNHQAINYITGTTLVLHIVAMFVGFSVLGAIFEFPEVLRYAPEERFNLLVTNRDSVVPTYWVLTMTGVTQILISVQLYCTLRQRAEIASFYMLVFGVLTGLCQALGFGRWVIVIPYLAEQYLAGGDLALIALIEGVLNHYLGMFVGEHLANICWAVWLLSCNIALIQDGRADLKVTRLGITLSPILILLAAEQIGLIGDILDPLVDFGFPILAVWHILLAMLLVRLKKQNERQNLSSAHWGIAIVLAVVMIGLSFTA